MEATAGKRSAHEALEMEQTTLLDDMAVVMPPAEKRPKLLDAELPDVDEDEDFPPEENELVAANSADAIDMEELETQQQEEQQEEDDDVADVDLDLAELAPPAESSGGLANGDDDDVEEGDEGEDEEQHGSETEPAHEVLNVHEDESEEEDDDELDIVDVGGSESAGDELARPEAEDEEEEDDEDEDDEEEEVMNQRNTNAHEARALLEQLDQSARSKLCLVALEKYGEELFFGHEQARDAILVDACGQDSILSLVREAVRVQSLYARGTSTEPVELDDDEDEDGSDEDEDGSEDDDDDEICLISEEETDNQASQETDEHENGHDEEDEDDDEDDAPTEEEDADPSNAAAEEVKTDG